MRPGNLRVLAGRLASYELFAVLFLTLAVLARPQWGVVALGILSLVWIARWLATGRLSVRTPLDWCLVGLALALPAALWISADLPLSIGVAAQLVVSLGLYYAVANSAAFGWQATAAVALVVASGAGLALVGLVGVVRSGSQALRLPQQTIDLPAPFDIHVNVLATALVLILPLAISLALMPRASNASSDRPWPLRGRLAAGAAAALMSVTLLLTQSRGAYAAVFAAGGLMAAMRWRAARWVVLALALLGTIAWWLAGDRLSGLLLAGVVGREAVWERALYAIADFPFSGIGLGLFGRVAPLLYPYFDVGAGPLSQAPHAHDLFLQVAVDTGLLGLISFLAVLLASAASLAWLWRRSIGFDKALVWGLAGGLLALVVHGLVDAGAWSSRVAPLLWMLLGLLAASSQREQQRRTDR